ncbi:MAG: hypothetical protein ACI4MS_02190 [Candidatus Coproplasma sp.]
MKKRTKIATTVLTALLCGACLLTGCSKDSSPSNQNIFGEFGYKGRYLYSFATQSILAKRAKEIISNNFSINTSAKSTSSPLSAEIEYTPDEQTVQYILDTYSACTIVTKYYVENTDQQQTKTDYCVGADFNNLVKANEYAPFSQLVAKYLISSPEMIDVMEALNNEFKSSGESEVAPFSEKFSYYTNGRGGLVIQARDFSQIPASEGGGISASYRQDTEIMFDNQNKIQKWQTSLGLYCASPQGTIKQGYILEMEFAWELRV